MPESTTPLTADQVSPWLRRYRPAVAPLGRIVCFGPAGASPGFYQGWAERVPADIEVQIIVYPGRERRLGEHPITDMAQLADAIHDVLAPRLDRPTVLFGHSMGASVGFEVTRRLEQSGATNLAGLVVSGRPSPRRQREVRSPVAEFDDEQIVAHLRELGGTPTKFLDDPDARAFVLPAFRTDFALIGRYTPAADARTGVPLSVLTGDRDPGVPAEDAPHWAAVADRFHGVRVLPGEHFYLVEQEPAVVAHVLAILAEQGARPQESTPAR